MVIKEFEARRPAPQCVFTSTSVDPQAHAPKATAINAENGSSA
jgi:hypothetical protein